MHGWWKLYIFEHETQTPITQKDKVTLEYKYLISLSPRFKEAFSSVQVTLKKKKYGESWKFGISKELQLNL